MYIKSTFATLVLASLIACGGTSKLPTETVEVSGPVATAPEPSSPTPPATNPPSVSFEGRILPRAGWEVQNTSGSLSCWTAYLTSFDDQGTAIASSGQTCTQPGDWFRGSFDRTCVQIDLTYGTVVVGLSNGAPHPFLAGFINGYGNVVRASQARDGCGPTSTPTPEPTPTPTPTPTPSPTPTPTPSPTPTPTPSPTPTPTPCDTPTFWDQSFENNKNIIKFNAHVRGQGIWTAYLYATSSLTEYTNNDPDYTKDTDTEVVTKCKNGQGELKVDYDWKNHSSRYWWVVIKFNGTTVYKSAAVDHNLFD